MKLEIPEFRSREEEVEFWGRTDTSDILEEAKFVEVVWEPKEDRCPRCGGKMEAGSLDIELSGGKATLHRVKFYSCTRCKVARLSEEEKEEIARLNSELDSEKLEELIGASRENKKGLSISPHVAEKIERK